MTKAKADLEKEDQYCVANNVDFPYNTMAIKDVPVISEVMKYGDKWNSCGKLSKFRRTDDLNETHPGTHVPKTYNKYCEGQDYMSMQILELMSTPMGNIAGDFAEEDRVCLELLCHWSYVCWAMRAMCSDLTAWFKLKYIANQLPQGTVDWTLENGQNIELDIGAIVDTLRLPATAKEIKRNLKRSKFLLETNKQMVKVFHEARDPDNNPSESKDMWNKYNRCQPITPNSSRDNMLRNYEHSIYHRALPDGHLGVSMALLYKTVSKRFAKHTT